MPRVRVTATIEAGPSGHPLATAAASLRRLADEFEAEIRRQGEELLYPVAVKDWPPAESLATRAPGIAVDYEGYARAVVLKD